MNEKMKFSVNNDFNNVNRLWFKNKLKNSILKSRDFDESIINLIWALEYVKKEGLEPIKFDDGKVFWCFLIFWLNKYDICNIMSINIVDYKRIDFFYFQDYPRIDQVIISKYVALRKYCKEYYDKIKL